MKTAWTKINDDPSTWPNDDEEVLLLTNDGEIVDATVERHDDMFYFSNWYGDDIIWREVKYWMYKKEILPNE